MTIVQYYEMLPINGKIVRHEIFELCDSKFREKRQISLEEAETLTRNCKKVFAYNGMAIYQQ